MITWLAARSRIPDLVAITARRTLVEKMGAGDRVLALHREDLWAIEHAPSVDARGLVERLLRETTILVNTSKQAVRVGYGEVPGPRRIAEGARALLIQVSQSGDGERECARLRAAHGFAEVLNLGRSTLWTLVVPDRLSEDEVHALQEELIPERGAGLLANRHYQMARVLAGSARPII